MEDFGYQKDEEQAAFMQLMRRLFLVGATLFSIACFVYVTINAYYFVYQDGNSGEIETIKSPEGPIKVSENENEAAGVGAVQIDRSIYEDIFGNNRKAAERTSNPKIREHLQPALPPKNVAVAPKAVAPAVVEKMQPIETKTPAKEAPKQAPAKDQKMLVYSDKEKAETPSKDLLTSVDGRQRTTDPMPTKPVAKKRSAVRVQVAAVTSQAAAEENWDRLNRLYPELFSRLKPFTQEVDLGKRGIFYRLQIGSFYNQIEAEEFCNRYVAQAKKSKSDCIVVE
jgi:hypothetical protein